MATGIEAFTVVAAATGFLPATVDRTARALRERQRDWWVAGGNGGGKNAARVQVNHVSNLLRGLSGALPSDAPEALEKLQNLVSLYRQLPPGPNIYDHVEQAFCLMDVDNESFEQWIERCLTSLAKRPWAEMRELLEDDHVRRGEIAFCPYDERIRIEWGNEFQIRRALVFAPPDNLDPLHKIVDQPRARRRLVLPLTALIKAAGLLAVPDAASFNSLPDAGDTTASPNTKRRTPTTEARRLRRKPAVRP
jgi:hypothetical protein